MHSIASKKYRLFIFQWEWLRQKWFRILHSLDWKMKKLSDKDIDNTNKRYSQRFDQYGHDQKSVGWGKKGRQIERFKL